MKGIPSAARTPVGWRRREAVLAWIMLAPALVVVVGLIGFPVVYNLWLSFHSVSLGRLGEGAAFVGLANYADTLADPEFLPAMKRTMGYSLASSVLVTLAGLGAAMLLSKPFLGRRWVRAVTLFPYVAPVVALAFVWRLVFDKAPSGLANWALQSAHVIGRPVAWLSEEGIAMVLAIAFQVWRYFPFAMLLVLARLQAVPRELLEAAQVDGAGRWGRFRHVILPEIRHVLAIVFVLRFVWTFNKFDDVYLLTRGDGSTTVAPILIRNFIDGGSLGSAAACSMMLTAVLLAVVVFYQRKVSSWASQ